MLDFFQLKTAVIDFLKSVIAGCLVGTFEKFFWLEIWSNPVLIALFTSTNAASFNNNPIESDDNEKVFVEFRQKKKEKREKKEKRGSEVRTSEEGGWLFLDNQPGTTRCGSGLGQNGFVGFVGLEGSGIARDDTRMSSFGS